MEVVSAIPRKGKFPATTRRGKNIKAEPEQEDLKI